MQAVPPERNLPSYPVIGDAGLGRMITVKNCLIGGLTPPRNGGYGNSYREVGKNEAACVNRSPKLLGRAFGGNSEGRLISET